jgi:hypothetical protein
MDDALTVDCEGFGTRVRGVVDRSNRSEAASVKAPVDATALLDRFELLFDETVDVLVFGAGIVARTVCIGLLRYQPGFRGSVGPSVLVGLQ